MRDPNTSAGQEAVRDEEQFRRSTAACMRSIASDPDLHIDLVNADAALQLGVVAPFELGSSADAQLALFRGVGDAIALVGAYHDAQFHQQVLPQLAHEQKLFNALERARCESLGVTTYSGIAKNIAWLHRKTHSTQSIKTYSTIEQLGLALACLVSETITGRAITGPVHFSPIVALVKRWRATIEPALLPYAPRIKKAYRDQPQFAQLALQIIQALDVQSLVTKGETDDEAQTTAVEAAPDDQEQAGFSDEQSDSDEEAMLEKAAADAMREELEEKADTVQSAADDADESGSVQQSQDAPVSSDAESSASAQLNAGSGYAVFSTVFDEVIVPSDLASHAELEELRDRLDQQISRHASLVGRLSGRLQRLLMAEQRRHWIFDLDEGQLDTSRLTRMVTQPMSSLSFKAESEQKFKDTTITLLLDNSKSMLGKPITIAASCADLLAQTLERCGVSVEILGFTTTELNGASVANQWRDNGGATNPGRLNGLRHIIYKSADTPYRSARKGLGLMLRGDILKQNIDGEALLWAHSRIKHRPEQRKIIMMISDGAPLDTSTMSVNPENYLIDHLHKVIGDIQSRSNAELVAIGIGHDVSLYYEKSITIYDVKKLGRAMLAQLTELFRDGSSRGS